MYRTVQNLWTSWRKNGFIHRVPFRKLLLLAVLVCTLTEDVPIAADRSSGLDRMLAGKQFDLVGWVISAAASKVGYAITRPHDYLTASDRDVWVRRYLEDLTSYQRLSARIEAIYADPAASDPAGQTAALREQRDALRRSLSNRQGLVEAILQDQIESILAEEDFGLAGQPLPPVRFQLTRLPLLLVVSRRDRIERIDQRELSTGLTVDEMDRVERQVDQRYDVSSLVTPIGGYATYPTMLPETSALTFIIETAIHEWTHNYLLFSPVGLNYNSDPVARTINETAAVIVQREVGARVLRRYYPDMIASAALDSDSRPMPRAQAFDFNGAMRETRLRADALLAEGRIDEAERYMEQRRAIFVNSGYLIRKLNQAYFAFYGAYNAEPGGAPAAGKDRVGPAVQALRARAPTLGAFVRQIAQVRTLSDVQAAPGS